MGEAVTASGLLPPRRQMVPPDCTKAALSASVGPLTPSRGPFTHFSAKRTRRGFYSEAFAYTIHGSALTMPPMLLQDESKYLDNFRDGF